jgi:hypothetical protein
VQLFNFASGRGDEALTLVFEHRVRREPALENQQSHDSFDFRDMITKP